MLPLINKVTDEQTEIKHDKDENLAETLQQLSLFFDIF